MSIADAIARIQSTLPTGCCLIAVSKTKPLATLQEAYDVGVRDFGENKVQEMTDKHEQLPKDIRWHMIGHLQRNKVKYIAPFVHLIHSVDSLRLLREIDKQGAKAERVVNCLLQVHIAEEENKFGLSDDELMSLLKSDEIRQAEHVRVVGLMGMATFSDNAEEARPEFQHLKRLFDQVKGLDLPNNVVMEQLSMGMSGDYTVAFEEGSTMIRIGTTIFGKRDTH
ncbi:MAG: YggS family pyridoxal phosphate-dependent enzyme [Tunicatimonas sp.]